MRNAVGREIPDEILRATGKEPFQGNNYKNGVPFRRQAPIIRPVSASTIISVKAT